MGEVERDLRPFGSLDVLKGARLETGAAVCDGRPRSELPWLELRV
jgi:hypothetical protein